MQLGKSNFQSTYHDTHKNLAILWESYHGLKKPIQDENPDQLILQLISWRES